MGYFLSSIILNKFDKKEIDSYLDNIGGNTYFLRWVRALGEGDKFQAKAIWKSFENRRYHNSDYSLIYPLILKVINKYPQKFNF